MMADKVQRFRFVDGCAGCCECGIEDIADGDFVAYEDYVKIENQIRDTRALHASIFDLIERLKEHNEALSGEIFSDRNHAALRSRAQKAEAELASLRASVGEKWIDVEQELPEVGARVLVWKTNADAEHIATFSPLGYPEFPWRDQFNSGDGPSISHWMPLPAPPTKDKE